MDGLTRTDGNEGHLPAPPRGTLIRRDPASSGTGEAEGLTVAEARRRLAT